MSGRDPRSLRGQPVLRRGALAAAAVRTRANSAPAARRAPATCRRPGSAAPSTCSGWRRPQAATSTTDCLLAVTACRSATLRDSLRRAVEHGVLVADQARARFRFRHALLADAVYATILPGEREGLHARLADELARSGAGTAAEIAPHWAAAGRIREALAPRSRRRTRRRPPSAWPKRSRTSNGHSGRGRGARRARARGHRPRRALLLGRRSREPRSEPAPRAIELGRQAVHLVECGRPAACCVPVRVSRRLPVRDRDADDAPCRVRRAVELVPPRPRRSGPTRSALARGGLMLAGRHAESLPIAEQALALSRERTARARQRFGHSPSSASTWCMSARGEDGVARLRQALRLAAEVGDDIGLDRAYVNLTSVLTMLGRNVEAAQRDRRVSRRCGGGGSRAP